MILSSTNPGDIVLDPFAGSGTTLVVAEQLGRKSIGIELDSHNITLIQNRLTEQRNSDDVSRFFKDYTCTPDLEAIWGGENLPRVFLQDPDIRPSWQRSLVLEISGLTCSASRKQVIAEGLQ